MKSLNNKLKKILLSFSTGLILPLGAGDHWHVSQFSNIAPNKVSFSKNSATIQVNNSASPLIYVLPKSQKIDSLQVRAHLSKMLKPIPEKQTQGMKKFDDFALRFGVIAKGHRRLNWIERQFAAQWILDMEKLLPSDTGVGTVKFLTTCRQKKLLGKKRSHFLNSSLSEECMTLIDKAGNFNIEKTFSQPLEVLGFWISSDGDDQNSRFEIEIQKIHINYSKKAL